MCSRHTIYVMSLGKKSKLSWLLIMKVEIFSFTTIAFLFLIGCAKAELINF